MKVRQAADALGISTRTLYRWVSEGCPHEGGGSGRALRFDLRRVAAWMERTGATGLMGRPPRGCERIRD